MRVATIAAIHRYPVKSMRGEALETVELGFQGLPGDRRYAFVQADSRSPFPYLTGRELPRLLRYQPMFEDESPRARLHVTTPDGARLPVDSEELRAELEQQSARRLFLLRDHRGNYDIGQVSLIGLATTAHIAAVSATAHAPARFRANFYVETDNPAPFAEMRWVGRILRLGATARVAVTEPDQRCVMITLHPETGEAEPAVLRAVARLHDNQAGVYATVLTPGLVRTGDPVELE